MPTQQETMRRLLNLMESETPTSIELDSTEINAIDQALSGMNEEQLNEINYKKLLATSAVVLATLAPGLSHALSSDEVKLASAVAACGALIDVASVQPNMPSATAKKLDNLAGQLFDAQKTMVEKAKKQGDMDGVRAIAGSWKNANANALNLIKSGNSDLFTKSVVQCVNWSQQK